jgi:thioredoxin-like negative regulator of GroEL
MTLLPDHEYFEALLAKREDDRLKSLPPFVVVYFTARWCGACKRLDLPKIVSGFPTVTFFKCDIDENDYTAGFCGIRSIPSFVAIKRGKFLESFGSSDTQAVGEWIYAVFQKE